MAYSLSTAISELKRGMFWNERTLTREPLEGLVDGSNKVFYLAYFPVSSSGTLAVYNASGTVISSGSYTIESYETGVVSFTTAPSEGYTASYTTQSLTDTELTNTVKNGFDKMEAEYNRNWYITSDSISSSSSSVVDPVTGSYTFSTSRLQVKLYLLCCEYELIKARAKYAAAYHVKYRESRTGGVQIDRTQSADQLMALLEIVQKDIEDTVIVCANQSGDTPWGTYIPGGRSDVYHDMFDYWSDGKQDRGEIP